MRLRPILVRFTVPQTKETEMQIKVITTDKKLMYDLIDFLNKYPIEDPSTTSIQVVGNHSELRVDLDEALERFKQINSWVYI